MPLLPPIVKGPLSECSRAVRVQGQITGSTVDLYADAVHVGSRVVSWCDEIIPLNGGAALAAGAKVTATQTIGAAVSIASPLPVTVQRMVGAPGYVGLKTHLYVCGECLWLDGMVPGAKVEVTVGGVPRGSGTAYDGSARLGLNPATGPGEILEARQVACGVSGPVTTLPTPDQRNKEQRLNPPVVESPLRACQPRVTISDVADGSVVTIRRTAGPPESGCFDESALWFGVPPLVLGETITASQEYPACGIRSPDSAPIVVGPTGPMPAPHVAPPLCDGGTVVEVSGLLPGSVVHIYQDGIDLGEGEAPDPTFDFGVPPLIGGRHVTATQELCAVVSPRSNSVTVAVQPASLPTPAVAGPLYECATVVRVDGLRPGTTLDVYSTMLAAPIGSQQVFATSADVTVAPQLIAGDDVYAIAVGCALTSTQSAAVRVRALPKVGDPRVQGPVDDCMLSVTVTNVVPGARVDVYVNSTWHGTASAPAGAVEVPILFGPLHVGDRVVARQRICSITSGFGEPIVVVSHVGLSYLTEHFDRERTGWNPFETVLTVANVPQLRQLFTHALDGTAYAQPLYVHHVWMPATGRAHNVLYVATENDSIYAFDADSDQAPLWHRRLVPRGSSVVSTADIEGCDNVAPVIGITSTPVIDCDTYTIYVVAKTKRVIRGVATFHQRLHALDIATGADRPGSPIEISARFPGSGQPNDGHGNVLFSAKWQLNRPALLLDNNRVYVAFGAHCDFHAGEYHGWIISYEPRTLAHLGTFNTSPNQSTIGAGIWQGGIGLAADSDGFVYCTTGNGPLDSNAGNYGDSVMQLRPDLTVAGYFAPGDQPDLLANDWDLGSGGVLVLPDQAPGTTRFPRLLVTCGKDGVVLLLNRQNLGGYTGPGGTNPQAVQTLPLQPGVPTGNQPGIWGGPAYYRGPAGQFVYYCGNGDALKAFALQNGLLAQAQVAGGPNQTQMHFPSEGGTTAVVSSNQQVNGTGVVWAIARDNPVRLEAFDALNLGNRLRELAAGPWSNNNGGAFIEPTVINGKVYVGSDRLLSVFGL